MVEEKRKHDEEIAGSLNRATRASSKKEDRTPSKPTPELNMEDAPKEKKQGFVEDFADSSTCAGVVYSTTAVAARTSKQAWDILAGLYADQNEAKISYLHKELESKIMQEDNDMNVFLADSKDLKEQLISVGEVILDHSLVRIVLDALPKSYETFASTWRFVTEYRPHVVKYDTLVSKLLQDT
ncbi:hypothetical protein L7F22_001377 [Adiantum nelumboides]|nr:hypothetical protein [Adiantum nelumboides]